MEKLQRFNKKGMKKAIVKAINEMSDEEAYKVTSGVYELYRIIANYYLKTYGSPKRLTDLFEYVSTLQQAYLKKPL